MSAGGRTRFARRLPFGAELQDDGSVRFCLVAPDARTVEVALEDRDGGPRRFFDTERLEDGRCTATLAGAGAMARYQYRIDGERLVPDPASRFQPDDVHGPSAVIDPGAFDWGADESNWCGRPWPETVLYELHVGAFTPEGTFAGVASRLDELARLGVTAIELMPVSDFPGRRNWGYDGVLPFAPDSSYGRPDDLKRLVREAHRRSIQVFLDVVYNHFGPEGNYLHLYAGRFFDESRTTPWGAALRFGGEGGRMVRNFFIENALYWIEEFRIDGLRLDAVEAIDDRFRAEFLDELAAAVRNGPGAGRHVHLVLENDRNESRHLTGGRYDAQWNDDQHHALHCLLTGERSGYYADYADRPAAHLARALAEGFAYQGERSAYRGGAARGHLSAHLPPTCFVAFLQNHDQIGNRAFGERLTAIVEGQRLEAAAALLLLAPKPPLLFMGEEYGANEPFPYFCDFGPELADAVREGRRNEFARFEEFRDPEVLAHIPDPNDSETFQSAVLGQSAGRRPEQARRLERYRSLLAVRFREIVPRLAELRGGAAQAAVIGAAAVRVQWTLGDGSRLELLANLGEVPAGLLDPPAGRLIAAVPEGAADEARAGRLGPWSTAAFLDEPREPRP